MSENLVSINDSSISDFFMTLSKESFNKEWTLYSEYNRKIKENKNGLNKISRVENLTAKVCSSMYQIFSGVDENIFKVLRDRRIYNKIAGKPLEAENDNGVSLKKFKEDFITGKDTSTKIKDLVAKELKNSKNKDSFEITNDFAQKIFDILKEKKSDSKLDEDYTLLEIDLSEKDNQNNYQTIKLRTSENRGLLWSQEDSLNLIKAIQKQYDLQIIKKSDYYIIPLEENQSENKRLIQLFCEKVENAIGEIDEYKGIIIEDSLKEALQKILKINGQSARDLLIGPKTENKIKGDIGEVLVGAFNQLGFGKASRLVGDIPTSTGEAAIDLYLKKLGFQVKNMPSSEGPRTKTISLYHSINQISTDTSESRGLSQEEKEKIYENFERIRISDDGDNSEYIKTLKQNIIEILKKALPNFIRYTQRFTNEEITKNNILKRLSNLKNNFYIVNFRLIPASRIFYELAESAKNTGEFNTTIDFLFYEDLNQTKMINVNKNLFKQINGFNKDKFPKSFYLYFKGIQLDYKGLTLQSQGGNLIASSFVNKPLK